MPAETAQPKPRFHAASFRRILSLARPEVASLVGGSVCLVFSSGTNLLFPQIIGKVVDQAQPGGGGFWTLDRCALFMLGISVVGAVASALRYSLFTIAGERVVARL